MEGIEGAPLSDDDDWEIVPRLPKAKKGVKCGECGMKFENGKAYGYYCPSPRCPIQLKTS